MFCTKSAQRLRRWSNIEQMLYKCFAFTVTCETRDVYDTLSGKILETAYLDLMNLIVGDGNLR